MSEWVAKRLDKRFSQMIIPLPSQLIAEINHIHTGKPRKKNSCVEPKEKRLIYTLALCCSAVDRRKLAIIGLVSLVEESAPTRALPLMAQPNPSIFFGIEWRLLAAE